MEHVRRFIALQILSLFVNSKSLILSFLSAVITRPSFLFQEQVIVGIKTLLRLLAKFQLLAGAFKLKQKNDLLENCPEVFMTAGREKKNR
jgi:hypothetical protein